MSGVRSILEIPASINPYVESSIDQYIVETSDPVAAWGKADPNPRVYDEDKLRYIAQDFASNLATEGDPIDSDLNDYVIREMAILCNSFQQEFHLLSATDAMVNCAMYALQSLGVKSKINRFSTAEEIEDVLSHHFYNAGILEEPKEFDFHNNDLLSFAIEGNPRDRHYVIVEKDDKKTTFRSKLGQLFVVRNSDLTDLTQMHHAKNVNVLRMKDQLNKH